MLRYLRIATVVFGVVFTILGVRWLIYPLESAEQLGMPLLDGAARSTQIGDLSTFFLVAGVTMLLGLRAGHARLLYVPAALVGGAAIARTIAWVFHGADFAALFIVVELVVGGVLVATARELDEGW
jgi:hypothetical protein